MLSDREYQDWWEKVWREREDLFKRTFGETSPPGTVIAFSWDDFELTVPGGCALVFPPALPRRHEWLTISHGLTQPLEPVEETAAEVVSGYGSEFGFLTKSREAWCPDALWYLLTYIRQNEALIDRGHRVPMWFSTTDDGNVAPILGKVPPASEAKPLGEMRALLFWPYMAHPGVFSTSTGRFSLLIGTTITQPEWELAKATSTSHLLMLLFEAGVEQRSDLRRESLTKDRKWQSRWEEISRMPMEAIDQLLLQLGAGQGQSN